MVIRNCYIGGAQHMHKKIALITKHISLGHVETPRVGGTFQNYTLRT